MRKSGPDTKVQTSSERNNGNGQLRNKKERMEKTRQKKTLPKLEFRDERGTHLRNRSNKTKLTS